MPRFDVQVIRRLQAAPPSLRVNLNIFIDIASLEIHVARDRLVDPLLRPRCHLDESIRTELEAGFVYILFSEITDKVFYFVAQVCWLCS